MSEDWKISHLLQLSQIVILSIAVLTEGGDTSPWLDSSLPAKSDVEELAPLLP